MSYETGGLVRATAGRDRDKLFWVVGREEETGRLLLADGKGRSAEGQKPQARRSRHHVGAKASAPGHPSLTARKNGL